MTNVFKVAIAELRSLFYSPIAWLVLIVFCVKSAYGYLRILQAVAEYFLQGESVPALTVQVFAGDRSAVLGTVATDLVWMIPLLTMGLISRERQSGSIRLLLSSPIRLWELVLGKYIAVLLFLAIPVTYLFLIAVHAGQVISVFDWPLAITALLGLFLLSCAYVSIGLFMSSVTSHQIVAAVSTFAVLALLSAVSVFAQRVPVVADIAFWLGLRGRVDEFFLGYLTSENVLYFGLVSALFVLLTVFRLNDGRIVERCLRRVSRYAVLLGLVATSGYLTSQPANVVYKDLSATQRNSLAPSIQAVFDEVTGPWRATAYVNVLDWNATRFLPRSQNRLSRNLFSKFLLENHDADINYVFYYGPVDNPNIYEINPGLDERAIARNFAKEHRLSFDDFLSADEVGKIVDVSAEQYRTFFLIESADRSAIVRTSDDVEHLHRQKNFGAAFKRIVHGPMTVAYVDGLGGREVWRRGNEDHRQEISELIDRSALINNGFDIVEVALDKSVSAEVDILVLAGIKQPLSSIQAKNLRDYLYSGRNLFVQVEPESAGLINPFLSSLGIEAGVTQLREPHEEFPDELIFARYTKEGRKLGFFAESHRAEEWPVLMPSAVAIEVGNEDNAIATSVLVTDSGDTTAVALTRSVASSLQKILIIGDADFMSSGVLAGTTQPWRNNNQDFLRNAFVWLSDGVYPMDTSYAPWKDVEFNISVSQAAHLKWLFYIAIPGLIFLIGSSILAYRRRR